MAELLLMLPAINLIMPIAIFAARAKKIDRLDLAICIKGVKNMPG